MAKKHKSDKLIGNILCSIHNKENSASLTSEERILIIEALLKHIIDNELPHIWLVIKIILAGIVAILGSLVVKFVTG